MKLKDRDYTRDLMKADIIRLFDLSEQELSDVILVNCLSYGVAYRDGLFESGTFRADLVKDHYLGYKFMELAVNTFGTQMEIEIQRLTSEIDECFYSYSRDLPWQEQEEILLKMAGKVRERAKLW